MSQAFAGMLVGLSLSIATAVQATGGSPSAGDQGPGAPLDAAVAEPAGLWDRDTLFGEWGGLRPELKDLGIALTATETGETFGIFHAAAQGAVFEGRFEADLDVDLEKTLGIHDAVLHGSAYQIHGRGPSASYLGGNLLTVSNTEAIRASRLFDLWLQKGFFDAALSIRLGQIAGDDEFFISQYAGGLINATFGWPAIMGVDLPSGGPAYPMPTPGIRIKGAVSDAFSVQAALFNGDPAGARQRRSPGAQSERYGIQHGSECIRDP